MSRTISEPPTLVLLISPAARFENGFFGSVVRLDVESPETWIINLSDQEIRLQNLVNALVLLLLDVRTRFMPRILLPAQPPYVLMSEDGEFTFWNGNQMSRDWLAVMRTMKLNLLPLHLDFFEEAFAALRGDCGDEIPEALLPDPSVRGRYGPAVPEDLLLNVSADRDP